MDKSGYPALCPIDINALHLQLNGHSRPTGLQAALLCRERERQALAGTTLENCSSLISWLGWPATPVCQVLKDFLRKATFITKLGKPWGKLGQVSHLCLADLGRMSTTHTGTQRHMTDSLQCMCSLQRSRTKLLLTLALPASGDCALSRVGSGSEEAFWPWRKLISGDTSSSLHLGQCLSLFWAWDSESKVKRKLWNSPK